jgi:acetyl-CoA C-acetyltransferase
LSVVVDARTPVLVGVGQLTPDDRTAPTSPLDLMLAASRLALADAGAPLLDRVESIGVTNCISWAAPDPGRALGEALGALPGETVATHTSGTSPLDLLRDACARIAAGELRVALLAGAETVRALQDGRYQGGPEQPEGTKPSRILGEDRMPTHPGEEAAGLYQPVQFYPLFENALRSAAGRDPEAHLAWLGALWGRFAAVADANPHAWVRTPPTAASIVDIGKRNRPVAFPYPKLLTANLGVDQGAALVVCSAEAAREAGIPRDRWVFVHGTAAGNDHWHVGERALLHRSPAIRAIGRALLDGVELSQLDLYSCFPSAVQIAAAELGVDLTDPGTVPTVTGGLTFAGGPGSNYVMHALATMVERLRVDSDGFGLCTGVGWFMTKHAAALLSSRPPRVYRDTDVQSEVDSETCLKVGMGTTGPATVETYTVSYDYDGAPRSAFVAARTGDDHRAFAATHDRDLAAGLLERDPIGSRVTLLEGARFDLD